MVWNSHLRLFSKPNSPLPELLWEQTSLPNLSWCPLRHFFPPSLHSVVLQAVLWAALPCHVTLEVKGTALVKPHHSGIHSLVHHSCFRCWLRFYFQCCRFLLINFIFWWKSRIMIISSLPTCDAATISAVKKALGKIPEEVKVKANIHSTSR